MFSVYIKKLKNNFSSNHVSHLKQKKNPKGHQCLFFRCRVFAKTGFCPLLRGRSQTIKSISEDEIRSCYRASGCFY